MTSSRPRRQAGHLGKRNLIRIDQYGEELATGSSGFLDIRIDRGCLHNRLFVAYTRGSKDNLFAFFDKNRLIP